MPEPDPKSYQVDFDLALNDENRWELQVKNGVDAVMEVSYKLFRMDRLEATIGGEFCYMREIEDQEEYILYNIPVRVMDMNMDLRAAYLYDGNNGEGEYKLYGLWNNGDTGSDIPSRDTMDLEDGLYAMHYEVVDALGRKQLSDPLMVQCENGDIIKEELISEEEETEAVEEEAEAN